MLDPIDVTFTFSMPKSLFFKVTCLSPF